MPRPDFASGLSAVAYAGKRPFHPRLRKYLPSCAPRLIQINCSCWAFLPFFLSSAHYGSCLWKISCDISESVRRTTKSHFALEYISTCANIQAHLCVEADSPRSLASFAVMECNAPPRKLLVDYNSDSYSG